MRIVVVTGIFPPDIGGPATHASDLADELASRGHDVTVLTLTDESSVVTEPGLVRWPRRRPWPLRIASVVAWLRRHRRRYDVVYATGMQLPALLGARIAGKPVVVKVVGDPAWERAARRGLTRLAFEEFQKASARGFRTVAMKRVRSWWVDRADAVVVPSRYLASVVRSWSKSGRDPVVIPNGVRLPHGFESGTSKAVGGPLRLLFVGRLVPHKNVDVLIDAVASVEGIALAIVGDGPARAELEARAAASQGSGRIHFTGSLDRKQVLERMAQADLFVSASGYEGLPHVAIEALACGTPLLAPPVGGMVEVLGSGTNGLLVDGWEVSAFVEALERLREPRLLEKITEGARSESRRWAFTSTADAIEALLRRVTYPRPLAVFLGKTRLPNRLTPDLERKFEIVRRHVEPVLVNVSRGRVEDAGFRIITLPALRPAFLGGLLYYLAAPPVALLLAARRRGVVVCQSPYEAIGIVAVAALLPARVRPGVIVEIHGDWRTAGRLYGSPLRRLVTPLADRIATWALLRADRLRVIGDYTENLVRSVGWTRELDRYIAFSDFSMFTADDPCPGPDARRAAFIGVLERYKGVDVLLEAWVHVVRALPDARLTICGRGRLMSRLTARAAELGVGSAIDFLGPVPRARVKEVLDESRFLVLPSRSEGLGLVILEAMARARPTVGSAVGGITELVHDGRTGLLVPPEDAQALAKTIVELFEDPDRCGSMGRAALEEMERVDPEGDFERGIERMAAWATARRDMLTPARR